jgi:hypothetical protein
MKKERANRSSRGYEQRSLAVSGNTASKQDKTAELRLLNW